MTIDIDHFWKLLSQSRLLDPSTFQRVSEEFNAPAAELVQGNGNNSGISAEAITDQLVDRKLLSSFQAEILLAGHPGPFQFGNYLLTQRYSDGPLVGGFAAIHRPSQMPVLLQFYGTDDPAGLLVWKQIEALAKRVGRIDHPNLARVFETVVLPHHRMVVSQAATGTVLCEKVPRKARLPWKDACLILLQTTRGLRQVHKLGIVHNAVSPRAIWMHRGGLAQLRMGVIPDTDFEYPSPDQGTSESRFDYLAPEVLNDASQLSKQSDIYSLGCTLVRLISGKPLFPESDLKKKILQHQTAAPPSLEKYEVPTELAKLIKQMVAKAPGDRPRSTRDVLESLAEIIGTKPNIKLPAQLSRSSNPALDRYLTMLEKWDLEKSDLDSAPRKVSISIGDQERAATDDVPTSQRIDAARLAAEKRKKQKWMMPLAIAASLLVISGLVVTIAMIANRPVPQPMAQGTDPAKDLDAEDRPGDEPAETGESEIQAILAGKQTLVQQLIDDDGQSLWESPTLGKPVELTYLPSNPRLLFRLQPAKILEQENGAHVIRSLGPSFAAILKTLESQIGLELIDIQRLTISLHPNDQFQYQPFFLVELPAMADHQRLLQIWNGPTKTELADDQSIYQSASGYAFYLVPETADPEKTNRFLYGPPALIEEVVQQKGITVLSGSMARMTEWMDDDRHFSMLFLRNALFNDEGQWLMSGPLSGLNQGLGMLLDDKIRGGLISVHFDRGSYLEFILDRNLDLTGPELRDSIDKRIRESRDAVTQFVGSLPANPYWDRVRQRFAIMLADVYRNLRIDVEYGQVTGNCWLPPMALHNLLAGSELVMAFSSGATVTTESQTTRKTPQTLDELLNAKRDLSVTTNPDLNILLSNIRDEVVEDWGSLPFDFDIRILANDLSVEGITQNQRPGDFEMQQTTLADILTEIMVRCNPDRNITGPNDPACKLVWVVADHPDKPGNQAVLVTTRAAAAQKNYPLPEAFRTE